MRLKSRSGAVGVAIFIGCFLGAAANAVSFPRIELLREARVTSSNVLLSDLLPEGAGDSLRQRAAEISLGSSPQPGNVRVLGRGEVLGNIAAGGNIAGEIAVPERIVVSREARPITVREVFAAIQDALEKSAITEAGTLHSDDILLQTEVLVGPGDAGLEVLRSEFDAGLKRGRFLLWASHDPKVLPFLVTARLAGNLPPAALLAGRERGRAAGKQGSPPVPTGSAKEEVLVSPGQQALLVLRSAALRMIADVVPLERGTMGQQVHVRVVDTGKIFSAQVDGRAHLHLNF